MKPITTPTKTPPPMPGREAGFALILAILALMLLTFLGLTLATTTSTELQIAANYKFSEVALYNAESGIEVGKAILRNIPDWNTILPPARAGTWDGVTAPGSAGGGVAAPFTRTDASGNPSRNFESWQCDTYANGMGYGVVLDDGGANAPYQYKASHAGLAISGAFTLWVRRASYPVISTGLIVDYTQDNDNLVLVSEGVAPFGLGMTQNRAVRVLEVALNKATPLTAAPCGTRGGQAGGGPEGANFSSCDPITAAGVQAGLGGALPTELAVK